MVIKLRRTSALPVTVTRTRAWTKPLVLPARLSGAALQGIEPLATLERFVVYLDTEVARAGGSLAARRAQA